MHDDCGDRTFTCQGGPMDGGRMPGCAREVACDVYEHGVGIDHYECDGVWVPYFVWMAGGARARYLLTRERLVYLGMC